MAVGRGGACGFARAHEGTDCRCVREKMSACAREDECEREREGADARHAKGRGRAPSAAEAEGDSRRVVLYDRRHARLTGSCSWGPPSVFQTGQLFDCHALSQAPGVSRAVKRRDAEPEESMCIGIRCKLVGVRPRARVDV